MQTIDKTQVHGMDVPAWSAAKTHLAVDEIPTTAVEVLDRTVSKHLRRWLGVPPSFTNIGLYGKTTKLQLPLSSLYWKSSWFQRQDW